MTTQDEWPAAQTAAWESALAEAAAELETQRSGQATVQWLGPFTVARAIQAGRGKRGLYVIYRSGQVVDSGKAEGQDLASRLEQHFEYHRRHQEPLTAFRIRLGIVRQRSGINLAEGTVTRTLTKGGWLGRTRQGPSGRRLNVPNTTPFRATGPGGVRLIHRGAMPRELQPFGAKRGGGFWQRIARGQSFEMLPVHLHSAAALEHELEAAAAEAEGTPAKRWFYWDALLSTNGGWEPLEVVNPVQDIRENGERIRSALQLKWQPTAQAQGRTLLVRCLSHTGSQWVDCRNHWF